MLRATVSLLALLAANFAGAASERPTESGQKLRPVVEEMATALRDRALPPKDGRRFDQALLNLRTLVAQDSVDMTEFRSRVRVLLEEIDSDGHTFLFSKGRVAHDNRYGSSLPPSQGPLAYAVSNAGGQRVLVFSPPALTVQGEDHKIGTANALVTEIRNALADGGACGLVVDLTYQTGGNAWPVLIALADLFTSGNKAGMVSRGGSTPLIYPGAMSNYVGRLKPENRGALAAFRGKSVAVVVGRKTSSAGEMIAIALRGEAGNRLFGSATGGYTTLNSTMELSNGDMLLLTVGRYTLDSKVIRGPVLPDEVFAVGAHKDDVLKTASEWALRQNCPVAQAN